MFTRKTPVPDKSNRHTKAIDVHRLEAEAKKRKKSALSQDEGYYKQNRHLCLDLSLSYERCRSNTDMV